MSTQNSLVIIKEKIAGVMLDDKRMKADDIAKKVLKGRKRECSTPPKWMQDAFHITKAESENGLCYYVKPKKKEVKNFFFYIHQRRDHLSLIQNVIFLPVMLCDCVWCFF